MPCAGQGAPVHKRKVIGMLPPDSSAICLTTSRASLLRLGHNGVVLHQAWLLYPPTCAKFVKLPRVWTSRSLRQAPLCIRASQNPVCSAAGDTSGSVRPTSPLLSGSLDRQPHTSLGVPSPSSTALGTACEPSQACMSAQKGKVTHLGGQQPHAGLSINERKEGGLLTPEELLDHYAAACREGTGLVGFATPQWQSDAVSHVRRQQAVDSCGGAASRQDVMPLCAGCGAGNSVCTLRGRPQSQCGAVCRQDTEHVQLCVMYRTEQNVVGASVRRCGDPVCPSTTADRLLAAVMAKRASTGRMHAAGLNKES